MAVRFTDILTARRRIGMHVERTPQRVSATLSQVAGQDIHLKLEHHQITGAFKLRGATNAILALPAEMRARGVVTASTGNHGRAVAFAAKAAGVPAVVCMSSLVPDNKVEAVEALGAEVHIVGKSQDEALEDVRRLIADKGMVAIPPFDHSDVIAGQGTIGIEMMEDAPDLDAVLVPLSGGGLISGVALAVKTMNPRTRIVGVSMTRGAAMIASLAAGHPVEIPEEPTLADSLGGGIGLDNRFTFEMVQHLVDDCLLVDEDEIARGIRFAYMREGEVIEGAAAVGIAAILSGKFRPEGATGIVLSGKNIAADVHRRIINGETPGP